MSCSGNSSSTSGWSALPTDPQFSERRYRVERSAARAVIAGAAELGVTDTPPSIIVVNNTLTVSLGEPAEAVDADAVVDEVLEGIPASRHRMEIEAELERVQFRVSAAELGRAVDEAHARYGRSLVVSYQDESHELTLETIAGWLILDFEASPPIVTLDESAAARHLEDVFAAQSAPFSAAAMAVVDCQPMVVASDGGVACCADGAGALVAVALEDRARRRRRRRRRRGVAVRHDDLQCPHPGRHDHRRVPDAFAVSQPLPIRTRPDDLLSQARPEVHQPHAILWSFQLTRSSAPSS